MRKYTADLYDELVEQSSNVRLQNFMKKEMEFIARIPEASQRTLVDLGAGHGRIVGKLSELGKNVIAIEINQDMYLELQTRSSNLSNVETVEGDFMNLADHLLGREVSKPVFLIVQNTLGTVEGNYQSLLNVVTMHAKAHSGEIVLSLFRQPTLESWGLDMYSEIKDMVGEYDPEKSNIQTGDFVSTTGYSSHWWTDEEISHIKSLGNVQDELVEEEFHLLRISF